MRIIGGQKGGLIIQAPNNLPVRPTTDRAKESLFNILQNRYDLEELSVLDLFTGTGNISYEFASRGSKRIVSVDENANCVKFIKSTSQKLGLNQIEVVKQDVFSYLISCAESFDIIFADAPYALPRIGEIPIIVFDRNLLNLDGMLILEHASSLKFNHMPNFQNERVYGQSCFSFFSRNNND
ncbi:MAG: RsmD family RNA methyltransferase [Bacteroidia bacterium]|nr:RsmD family RNA methyltransferase [Bacteroidia bacterium]